ncbi:MAG TPA: hypothetical protein VF691_22085, partial [Cytophagaceae bacterium]
IFKILLKSNVIAQLSSSIQSRVPFYQFTGYYDYLSENLPEQAINFMEAVKGLFKSTFLYIVVVDQFAHHVQFITHADYEKLTLAEKFHFSIVPMEVVLKTMNLN